MDLDKVKGSNHQWKELISRHEHVLARRHVSKVNVQLSYYVEKEGGVDWGEVPHFQHCCQQQIEEVTHIPHFYFYLKAHDFQHNAHISQLIGQLIFPNKWLGD